jgi:hypothetical protein
MDETKRVLVYGGHGNVGQYLVKYFQDNGYVSWGLGRAVGRLAAGV